MNLIAELGVNWNSYEDVIEMMDKCDQLEIKYVKFQMWRRDQAPQEIQHCCIDNLRAEKFFEAGKNRGLEVFFSIMYPIAINFCEKLGVNYYKLRYADSHNLKIYREIKKITKPLFISCIEPKNTLFYNLARHQNNIKFLYCVPIYPAKVEQYKGFDPRIFQGISDHTDSLELFKTWNHLSDKYWFEMHVCLDKDCYESRWSKTFDQLEEVLA